MSGTLRTRGLPGGWILAVTWILLSASRPGLAAPPTVVKMGTGAPEGSPWHQILKTMGEKWRESSGGAVTLRIYLPLSQMAGLPFDAAYQTISWLCWVPNLIVAEWIILRQRHTASIHESDSVAVA